MLFEKLKQFRFFTRKKLTFAGESQTGLVRKSNEDRFFYISNPHERNAFAVVTDGIGGHNDGDIASELCCNFMHRAWHNDNVGNRNDEDKLREFLIWVIEEANREIREQSKKLQQTKPMGCTVVAAIITPNKIIVANAGDSRCYGKTRSSLVMLSCDHTLRSKILNESRENGTEIVDLPAANIICKAVGPSRRVKPEINVFPRNDYEKLMLCSDGLTTMVDDSLIAEIMDNYSSPQKITAHLMCEALKNGGTDNITIISANLKR